MTDKTTHLQASVKAMEEAGNRLSFMAQTSGGTAGRDDGLMAAIDGWTAALAASIPADPVTNAGCCQALVAERDDLRAKLDVAVVALEELSRDPRADSAVLPDGWAYYSDAVNYARATLAKIKGAVHE